MSGVSRLEALQAVAGGADIYGYELALRLREIERDEPGLVEIGRAMCPTDGTSQEPYFGCMATAAGIAEIDRLTKGAE